MTKAKAKRQVATPKVELSEKGIARREAMRARNMARPNRPESAIEVKNGKASVGPAKDQDSKLYAVEMLEALGTRSIPFLNETLSNITRVMSPTLNASEQQHNAAIAIMASVEPENELEATLAAQMVMPTNAQSDACAAWSGPICRTITRCTAIWPTSSCGRFRHRSRRCHGSVAAVSRW